MFSHFYLGYVWILQNIKEKKIFLTLSKYKKKVMKKIVNVNERNA